MRQSLCPEHWYEMAIRLFKKKLGLLFWAELDLGSSRVLGLARATHAMGKARPSAWAKPPPVELHLWTRNLARLFHLFFFTDFIFIRFLPTLCNGTLLWIPKPILQFGSGFACLESQTGLRKLRLQKQPGSWVLIREEETHCIDWGRGRRGEGRGKQPGAQFLYDYNQLRFSFCFITLGKAERVDLPRPHHLTHLQVIEPALHIFF